MDFFKELDQIERTDQDRDHLRYLLQERNSKWQKDSNQKFRDILNNLPFISMKLQYSPQGVVQFVPPRNLSQEEIDIISKAVKDLCAWKKGPFQISDLLIDTEWKSNLKWDRLLPHLEDLQDKVILDIGCNNGYFMYRMAAHHPKIVLGIDPVIPLQAQYKFLNHFAPLENMFHELWGVEHLVHFRKTFDCIFSLGILYHHRHPLEQLLNIREALVPGGTLYLETIGIKGEDSLCLFPEGKYAAMRNIWFLPTLSCLINWLKRCQFIEVEVISTSWDKEKEQRATQWNPDFSYSEQIDPQNPHLSVEGYPAPERFMLRAKKKS